MIEVKNANGDVIFIYQNGDTFDDADLSGVNLSGAILEGRTFFGTNMSGANLEGADFYWAVMVGVNLRNANLRNASLLGCDLKESDLRNADLTGANLGTDNLGGSTQLEGANLKGCKTNGTIFFRAIYNAATQLPDGFDPVAHEMRYYES